MAATETQRPRSRAIAISLGVASALVAALWLAMAGAASAQTAFQASVKGVAPLPVGCSSGAFFCGTADIAGYGTGSWDFFVGSVTVDQTSCGTTYTATVDFTLASDGSTLALDESGNLCAPGKDGISFFAEGPTAFGHPFSVVGTWTVDTADSTGQFAGLGGLGTDAIRGAGAYATASYTGTLG